MVLSSLIYLMYIFRFKESDMPRKRGLLKLGSKFRYSGRTLYQSKMAVSAVDRPMPNFDRIHSKRATYGGRPNKRPHEIEGRLLFIVLIFANYLFF